MATEEEATCPVDHSTRDIWIKQHAKSMAAKPDPPSESASEKQEVCPVDHNSREVWLKKQKQQKESDSCSSDDLKTSSSTFGVIDGIGNLPTDREVSSIPRTDTNGKWIYPSQQQFFNAMKRKKWDPQEEDMPSVVPIHNAVNERAWMQILQWETNEGSNTCGGPKLESFKGDSKKLTPKARFNLYLGYQRPFDRHDWIVDRCGKKIEYVIDFYSGKPMKNQPDIPSFYLDVRPKLNSFEGFSMRFRKFIGLKD